MYYVKRGRKRFRITQEMIRRLPTFGTASQFARHLGVSRAAISQWIEKEGLPGYWQNPNDQFEAHYLIVLEDFLNWAEATERYSPGITS